MEYLTPVGATGLVAQQDITGALHEMRGNDGAVLDMIHGLLARIEAVEPVIQAFVPEENRTLRLLAAGSALRSRWPDAAARPALYGLALGVKDIFHVDGLITQAGSALPPALFAGPQATVVTRLLAAGAVVVGKTVTAEFAHAEPGPTRNPHRPTHTPGGSSSGSAAAVASGMCMAAIGSQTIGSVIRPAAYCGIVGFKPSYGRIPADGVVFYSRSVDHVGLFAPDVATMQVVAAAVCDGWHGVDAHAPVPGPVILVPRGPYLAQAEPEALAAFDRQLQVLSAAGYAIQDAEAFADIDQINRLHGTLIRAELATEHARWFSEQEHVYRPRTAQAIREGLATCAADLAEARRSPARLRGQLDSLLARSGASLFASPAATGPAPHGLNSTGNSIMNLPWTHAGLPTVTIPAGESAEGLPLGLQLSAPFGADETLLAWAGSLAERLEGRL